MSDILSVPQNAIQSHAERQTKSQRERERERGRGKGRVWM